MKVSNEHLSKEEKQVVADEAAATERAKQAEPSKGVHPPAPVGGGSAQQAAVGGRPAVPVGPAPGPSAPAPTSAPAPREPLAPVGAQILRHVQVGMIDHYYIIGLAPPYAGAALWVDILPTMKAEEEFDRRLRRA